MAFRCWSTYELKGGLFKTPSAGSPNRSSRCPLCFSGPSLLSVPLSRSKPKNNTVSYVSMPGNPALSISSPWTAWTSSAWMLSPPDFAKQCAACSAPCRFPFLPDYVTYATATMAPSSPGGTSGGSCICLGDTLS